MNKTAHRLRELRARSGLSQQEVADYLGISRTAYNKYESGVIQPTRKLLKLMDLFHTSADYLLGREAILMDTVEYRVSPYTHSQIRKYLSLPPDTRHAVDTILDALFADRSRQQNSL